MLFIRERNDLTKSDDDRYSIRVANLQNCSSSSSPSPFDIRENEDEDRARFFHRFDRYIVRVSIRL